MNFQGLHRTIQFSISSLALGKRQKHNISRIFVFANRFLNFFDFFQNRSFSKFHDPQNFSVLYQPAASSLSTRNRNIIYHRFGTLQIIFEKFLKNLWFFVVFRRIYGENAGCGRGNGRKKRGLERWGLVEKMKLTGVSAVPLAQFGVFLHAVKLEYVLLR